VLAFDLNRREARRQRRARHDVLRTKPPLARVEVDRVALADVGRADAQARMAGVEEVEIDEPLERAPERSGIVEAECRVRAPGVQPG